MKLLKPNWVHHDGKPIFSVDVHQDCQKFATGGQGLDTGRVAIWNVLPLLSVKAEHDDSIPKMLCQMDTHLACVNCVRWSQTGQLLASGSDDKLVMIWRKSNLPNQTGSTVFGTGGERKHPESWKCAYTLRGHSGDVLDLAWSPQDRWLASCSVDNTIIIWDAQQFPALVKVLKAHTGLVKGVAWDPVGKFLASQSDDRSVKIWKTSDWTCSNTITEPFEECGGTTHILRMSWSPDGQYLVSAHAMNGGGPTAQIIEREGWKCDKDFVGHRKAVTCVRFHNSILKRQSPGSSKSQQYCILAVGSRDCSLSVWMTALQRPLVVIHELFNNSVLDLSWGPKKCILMACSGDGTVAYLQFKESELGMQLSMEDKNALYQRIYGKSAILENGNHSENVLIENPEILDAIAEKPKPPKLLAPATAAAPDLTPAPALAVATPSAHAIVETQWKSASIPSIPNSAATHPTGKQKEVILANGCRRITPIFIPDSASLIPAPTTNGPSSMLIAQESDTPVVPVEEDCSPAKKAKMQPTESIVRCLDNRLTKSRSAEKAKCQPRNPNADGLESFLAFTAQQKQPVNASTALSNGTTVYQANSCGPKGTFTSTNKGHFTKYIQQFRVQAKNGFAQGSTGSICRLTAWRKEATEELWHVLIGSTIINFNLCAKYVVCCSLDGSLRLYDMLTGQPLLPVINLEPASMHCSFSPSQKYVGILAETGLLWILDIEKRTANKNYIKFIGNFDQIVQFDLTVNGTVVLLYANGDAFAYESQLQCWLPLSTKDPLFRHGLQTCMPKEYTKDFRVYPLLSVQGNIRHYASEYKNVDVSASNVWQNEAKIHFIENQIKLCEFINSEHELRHWYAKLVFQLAANGDEKRLRLLLDDLLGPAHASALKEVLERRKVLSISKLSLFESALEILKSYTKWQRLYMEYSDLFANIKIK